MACIAISMRAVRFEGQCQDRTIHRHMPALRSTTRRVAVGVGMFDSIGVEAVEVKELGIGEEVEVGVGNTDVSGDVLGGRRDGVEVGEVLRHIGCATTVVGRRHDGGLLSSSS